MLHEDDYFDFMADGQHMEINKTIDRVYAKAMDLDMKARELKQVANLANNVAIRFEDFSDSIASDPYPYVENISPLTVARTKRKFEEMPTLLKEVFLSEYILHNVAIPKDKDNPYHYRKLFENIESAAYVFVDEVKTIQDEIRKYEEYKKRERQKVGYDLPPARSYVPNAETCVDFDDYEPLWDDV